MIALLFALPPAFGAPTLEQQIDKAAELNVSAPLSVSQPLLDVLLLKLDEATPKQRARILLLQARNVAITGDCDRAIKLLAPLRAAASTARLRLEALSLSVNCAFNTTAFEQGFRFLRTALDLIPQVDDVAPRVKLITGAAFFHSRVGEGEKGIAYANHALALARSENDTRLICMALHELALAQNRVRGPAAALETRQQSVRTCKTAGDPIFVGVSEVALGELLLELEEPQRALEFVNRGLQTIDSTDFLDGILSAKLARARVLLAQGNPDVAKDILVDLVDQFREMNYPEQARDTYYLLSEIAQSRGNYEQALAYQKAAEAASARLLDRERMMRLAYLQVEFDAERKEQQINLLEEQNRVLELQDQAQRQRVALIGGGALALFVIGMLLFFLLLRARSDRRRILRVSQRDSLTTLYNHTNFFARADRSLAQCRNQEQPFSLVLADIDFFKQINDVCGHAVGDEIIERVGTLMRSIFEPDGFAGRVGGDEFAAALPNTDVECACALVRQFRTEMQKSHGLAKLQPSLSFGVAQSAREDTLEDLRQRADRGLYEAKRLGRNRLAVADFTDGEAIEVDMSV